VPTLRRRMRDLADHIRILVFFDDPVPDGALVALIDDMVEVFSESADDVLAIGSPFTEAVKWVGDGFVVGEVDRSRLVTVRCPEVVDRDALEAALSTLGDEIWVSPTSLIVSAGGSLRIFDQSSRLTTG
jgi:2-C-methyl-D-erythritol 4-phosphate cytidylyltransferase